MRIPGCFPHAKQKVFASDSSELVLGRIIGLVLQVRESKWVKCFWILIVPFIILDGVGCPRGNGAPRDECSIRKGDIFDCFSRGNN